MNSRSTNLVYYKPYLACFEIWHVHYSFGNYPYTPHYAQYITKNVLEANRPMRSIKSNKGVLCGIGCRSTVCNMFVDYRGI